MTPPAATKASAAAGTIKLTGTFARATTGDQLGIVDSLGNSASTTGTGLTATFGPVAITAPTTYSIAWSMTGPTSSEAAYYTATAICTDTTTGTSTPVTMSAGTRSGTFAVSNDDNYSCAMTITPKPWECDDNDVDNFDPIEYLQTVAANTSAIEQYGSIDPGDPSRMSATYPATGDAFGITDAGTVGYFIDSSGKIVSYSTATNTFTVVASPGLTGMAMGAVDPVNNWYYFSAASNGAPIYAFNTVSNTFVGQVGKLPASGILAGDFFFDSAGNGYLLTNGSLSRFTPPTAAGTAAIVLTAISSGYATDIVGAGINGKGDLLTVASDGTSVAYDPATGHTYTNDPVVPTGTTAGSITDASSCDLPALVTVVKSFPNGLFAPTDNFTITQTQVMSDIPSGPVVSSVLTNTLTTNVNATSFPAIPYALSFDGPDRSERHRSDSGDGDQRQLEQLHDDVEVRRLGRGHDGHGQPGDQLRVPPQWRQCQRRRAPGLQLCLHDHQHRKGGAADDHDHQGERRRHRCVRVHRNQWLSRSDDHDGDVRVGSRGGDGGADCRKHGDDDHRDRPTDGLHPARELHRYRGGHRNAGRQRAHPQRGGDGGRQCHCVHVPEHEAPDDHDHEGQSWRGRSFPVRRHERLSRSVDRDGDAGDGGLGADGDVGGGGGVDGDLRQCPMDEYALTSVTCTGIGSGTAMANLPSDIVTLDAAATAAGNIIACTFTNTAFPLLSVSKVLTSVNGVAATPGEVVHGGDVLVYTINVNDTGAGPGSAAVTDPVPVTVSVSTVTCTTSTGSSCTPGPQTNAVAGSVTLLANGTATYLVTGTAAGNLTNTAPVTPGCATQRGGGTGTTPPTTATDKPVFTQTKTADQSSYFVGAPITYTISVANTGAAAGTASVADAVPSIVAVSAVACSASAGSSCVPGPQTNTVAGSVTLLTNGTATYLVTGTVTAAGNLTNTAPVTPTTPGCTTQCGGGTGTTPPITAGNIPFFTESKTADQSSYHVGQPITYTITVNNTGAGSGSASVTDPVPAPVTVTTVTCTASTGSSGTPGPQTDAVAGSVTLLANGTATFLITGTVASTGSLVNTATITATTPGCTTQCGGSPASTPITQNTAAVDLAATKTLDQPAITAGAPITYLARMSNAGPVRSRLELHDADEYRGRPGVAVTGPRSVHRRRLPEGRRM